MPTSPRPPPAPPGGRFTIAHHGDHPLQWSVTLESAAGPQTWRLPDGLPWREGESRPASPGEKAHNAWDHGRWVPTDDGSAFLEGRRVRATFRFDDTQVTRTDAPPSVPLPARIEPMLATAGNFPSQESAWAYELKWDGVRASARVHRGDVRLTSRNGHDMTAQYPELAFGRLLEGRAALLDGEIVALDASGMPSFQLLQTRMNVTGALSVARRAQQVQVTFIAFDIPHLDGHDLTRLPYEERRVVLESLDLNSERVRTPPAGLGAGRELLAIPGLEGIVAKRLGSTYEPGARSAAWRKVKEQRRQEFVIAGYTAGQGGRAGTIGALMLGYHKDGKLRYAGTVGTGFTDKMLASLKERFAPLEQPTNPFDGPVDKEGTFIQPTLVGEVEFTEWTREGHLRHPSFKGLRDDKDARDVVREE